MAWTKFGPGTVTYTVGTPGTPMEFAQEVKGGGISHAYEDVGDATTYLDGTTDAPGQLRADSATFECDFDLGTDGFYNFLFTNDGATATLAYTPNTADGAKWEGPVRLRLPDGATAESFGSKIAGAVTHNFTGVLTFTPNTTTP